MKEQQTKIKPLLVFPPGWTPFGPYLALPVLKGYLEQKGIPTEIWDLNIDFFDSIFTKNFLKKAFEKAEKEFERLDQKPALSKEEEKACQKYIRAVLSKNVIHSIERAKQTIRSKKYYDSSISEQTNNILFGALQLASCMHEDLEIRFNKIQLKYSTSSTQQILKALEDKTANPFIDYYSTHVLPNVNPEINFFGISVTSNSQLIPALTLAKLIKKKCPNIRHIVLGGNLITRLAMDWEKPHPFFQFVDFFVCYEGEEALYQLIQVLNKGGDIAMVPNLCFVRNGILIKNKPHVLAVSEHAIPNFDGYAKKGYLLPDLVLPLYSSRSCFAKCAFCTIPFATYGSYRVLSTDKIYAAMETLSKKYGTNYFSFVDETFAPPVMKKIADKIIEKKAPFQWYGETRFTPQFTEDFCNNLYQGGCRKIQFGLESYNQRILDLMEKGTKTEWIEPAMINCFKAGIAIHMFFMVGFPTETLEEALNTIQFSKRMISLSKEKYNNSYTTHGWDTFGLDKYSAIWRNPSSYSVTVQPAPAEKDMLLQYEYTCNQGLSPKEARYLVNKYSRNPSIILESSNIKPFHDRSVTLYSEELPFLRICRKDLPQKNTEEPVTFSSLSSEDIKKQIKFNRQITRLRIRHSVYSADGKNETKWILFHHEKQHVMVISGRFSDLIQKLERGLFITAEIVENSATRQILENMIAWGFVKNPKTAGQKPYLKKAETILCYDPNNVCQVREGHSGEVFLFQYAYGKVIKISFPSLLLLQKFKTPMTATMVYTGLSKNSPNLSWNGFQQFIETALQNKFLGIFEKPAEWKGGEKYGKTTGN